LYCGNECLCSVPWADTGAFRQRRYRGALLDAVVGLAGCCCIEFESSSGAGQTVGDGGERFVFTRAYPVQGSDARTHRQAGPALYAAALVRACTLAPSPPVNQCELIPHVPATVFPPRTRCRFQSLDWWFSHLHAPVSSTASPWYGVSE
jgi:hypothetical protein